MKCIPLPDVANYYTSRSILWQPSCCFDTLEVQQNVSRTTIIQYTHKALCLKTHSNLLPIYCWRHYSCLECCSMLENSRIISVVRVGQLARLTPNAFARYSNIVAKTAETSGLSSIVLKCCNFLLGACTRLS